MRCLECNAPLFHHLGCRVLEKRVYSVSAIFAVVTLAVSIVGVPSENVLWGVGLTGFWAGVGLLSAWKRRERERQE